MAVAATHTIEEQVARARDEGWGWGDGDMRTETEALELLYSLVRITKPTVCVETGTYFGHGTQAISEGLRLNDRGHLWTVDIDDPGYEEKPNVTYVQADSLEWSKEDAPAKIDFCFIDCCETPEDRTRVFKNLLPRMNPGGLICAHDTAFLVGYLEALIEAIGRPPNLHFPALAGISVWVCE